MRKFSFTYDILHSNVLVLPGSAEPAADDDGPVVGELPVGNDHREQEEDAGDGQGEGQKDLSGNKQS